MKVTFKHRADYYFWAFALVVMVKGLLQYVITEDTCVLNIGDTYYVASGLHVSLFNTTVLLIIGLLYTGLYATGVPLFKKLTKLHTAGSMMVFIAAWIILPLLKNYFRATLFDIPWYTDVDVVRTLLIVAFMLVQFLLLINATIGIIKKLKAGN